VSAVLSDDGPAHAYDRRFTLAYMHVPKTSGTAMRHGIATAIGAERTLYGLDRSSFGAYSGFDSMSRSIGERVYASPQDLPRDQDFMAGHFALSTLQAAYPEAQIITFLREPLSRTLSHWMYWRSIASRKLRHWGGWADRVRCSHGTLAAFLETPEVACVTDNILLRMLLWPHPLIPDDGFIAPAHDAVLTLAARERLAQLAYADVIENPDFLDDFSRWLGHSLRYAEKNVTTYLPPDRTVSLHQELSDRTMALLDARTRLDLRLWQLTAQQHVRRGTVEDLRVASIARSIARHSRLGCGAPAHESSPSWLQRLRGR
jgi:hypothetical protein